MLNLPGQLNPLSSLKMLSGAYAHTLIWAQAPVLLFPGSDGKVVVNDPI